MYPIYNREGEIQEYRGWENQGTIESASKQALKHIVEIARHNKLLRYIDMIEEIALRPGIMTENSLADKEGLLNELIQKQIEARYRNYSEETSEDWKEVEEYGYAIAYIMSYISGESG